MSLPQMRVQTGRLLIAVGALALFACSPGTLAASPDYPCENERFGFGVTTDLSLLDVTQFQAGWYVNWGASSTAPHPAGMDYAPMIQTRDWGYAPSGASLLAAVDRNPGALWLVGNEPDNPWQGSVQPENYARIYHDVYQLIKGRDPTAQVAIGGMTQATPLRLQWLDLVWESYLGRYGQTMPVDVWNIHTFVLREVRQGFGPQCAPPGALETGDWGALIPAGLAANCGRWIEIQEHDRMDLLQEDIVRFRTWMRDHGQQNKPLVVSEYAILFPEELGYDYPRVRDFMIGTFDYFLSARDPQLGYPADDYRLVQEWAWYSLDDYSFGFGRTQGALMDPRTGTLYALGEDFVRYISNLSKQCPGYVDLQPSVLHTTTPNSIPYGEVGLVRLALEVRNQGNRASSPASVSFWEGDPDAGGQFLGTVPMPAVPSRYEGTVTASLDRVFAARGTYTITAQVDVAGQVVESREDNNRQAYTIDFGEINLTTGPATWQLERGALRPGEATSIRLNSATITQTQITPPGLGLQIAPAPYRVTWWDGDPDRGGTVIASFTMPAPKQFGAAQTIPKQTWSTIIAAPRTLALAASLEEDAPESTLLDNRVELVVPATTNLVLTAADVAGAVPVAEPDRTYDVQLRFRVANIGTVAPSLPIVVGVWPGTVLGGTMLGQVTLQSTEDWTDPLPWLGLSMGVYPFRAKVDPDDAVPESNEEDNTWAGMVRLVGRERYLPLTLR
jgi:hypothetical protein